MSRRPRIGITTYHRDGSDRLAFSLPAAYVDAVRAGGGLPLLLPPGEAEVEELLDHVDALVFGGGGDLDPVLWEGPAHETHYFVNPERDGFELALMAAALERRLPVLAICRGLQVLNVARGGSLHAHLPDVVGSAVPHRESQERPTRHGVSLARDTPLARVFRAAELEVASWHHQGVDRIGAGLRAIAWAPDGTIEALEDPSQPQIRAVQWHPELPLSPKAPASVQIPLFAQLVEEARARQR